MMQEISAIELMAIYKSASVVDVREMDEYVDGHVPGAKHIPLSMIPLRNNEIAKETKHYVICEAGGRSAQACAYLAEQGFDVVNISGGTGSWRMMGAPLNIGEQA
jgi:rhodanese-related sulfurtransferase